MRKAFRTLWISIAGLTGAFFFPAPALALSFSDFSSSVSGKIGQGPSSFAILITCLWMALACVLLYIAYRITVAKQRKAIDEAYNRMMERKRKPPKPPANTRTSRPVKPYKPSR